jgi:ABC-type multidrug transport system ATPase subunit
VPCKAYRTNPSSKTAAGLCTHLAPSAGYYRADEATSALDPESQNKLMGLLTEKLDLTTIISVGHRPELETFLLERRRGGARFVTNINLVLRSGRKRLLKRWLGTRKKSQSSTI